MKINKIFKMVESRCTFTIFILLTLLLVTTTCLAADHAVRPAAACTNNGDGSAWNCAASNGAVGALRGIPTTLTRGDTYYIASGQYGAYNFNTAESGTTWIYIRKAISSSHGPSGGWEDLLGNGKATFTSTNQIWKFNNGCGYIHIDGQIRDASWTSGAVSSYGIRVEKTNYNGQAVMISWSGSPGASNLVFKNVHFKGPGLDTSAAGALLYADGAASNITIDKCAFTQEYGVYYLIHQVNNITTTYSFFGENGSDNINHGEPVSTGGGSNQIWKWNVFENPTGTAVIAAINCSGINKVAGNTINGLQFIGNLVYHKAGYSREGLSGIIMVDGTRAGNDPCAGSHCCNVDNAFVYNNTMYGIAGTHSGVLAYGLGNAALVTNNIWYSSVRTASYHIIPNNNWYYNTTADADVGSGKIVCTSNCDTYFRNISTYDFRLSGVGGQYSPLNNGIDASDKVINDILGVPRMGGSAWDIGAYKFRNSNLNAPANFRKEQ